MTDDPFAAPAKISSNFASADSFRGRLVMIVPTKLELDVPSQDDPTKVADRLTADVTTLDGRGRVEKFTYKVPTGVFFEGPQHKGVWFSQKRVVEGILGQGVRHVPANPKPVLGILETYKPGKPAGPGNPWGLVEVTPEQKQTAIQELARIMGGGAAAPAPQPAPAPEANPFGGSTPPPF